MNFSFSNRQTSSFLAVLSCKAYLKLYQKTKLNIRYHKIKSLYFLISLYRSFSLEHIEVTESSAIQQTKNQPVYYFKEQTTFFLILLKLLNINYHL